MNIPVYEMYNNPHRLPYLQAVRETAISADAVYDRPAELALIIRATFHTDIQPEEHFYMVCMDIRSHITGFFEVAHGTESICCVNVSQLCRRALLNGATSVVLAHNHPSGDETPSQPDIDFTQSAKAAMDTVGIQLIDHIILAGGNTGKFYSFSACDMV